MNGRMAMMLVVAFVFAAVAAIIAKVWIDKQVNVTKTTVLPVVVAATEIPFGIKLEQVHLKIMDWQGEDAPVGSFKSVEDVIGKISKNSFYPGEVITDKRIAEHMGGSTLSSLISMNHRAISIRVDDVVGVAGFILPGNRIDILSIKRVGNNSRNAVARTILENIKVLAVDQEASPDKEKPAVVRAVTLELKPEQAEKIAEAMQEGRIQLTLRNPVDSAEAARKEMIVEPTKKVTKTRRRSTQIRVVPW